MRGGRTQSMLSDSRSIERHRLVEIDKKYALMTSKTQRQVSNQLEQQLDYLLGKKERQILKKKKLKELEESFENERNSRISKINHKITRSDFNRKQELSYKRAKSKKQLDRFNNVRKKVEHNNQEELQKHLEIQKNIAKQRQSDSRSSIKSQDPKSSRNKSFVHRRDINIQSIQSKIQNIEFKIDHATTNSKYYYSKIVQKAKGNSKNTSQIIDKIRAQGSLDQSICINNYYKRATHINDCGLRSKSFYLKQSEKKKKTIEEKFKVAKRNLRVLDRQREVKHQELQIKFDKSFVPKNWKNDKNETYLQRFLSNQKEIDLQKSTKAQNIIKKHLDMTLRNKALRQKKEKIHQTMKQVQI